MSKKLPKTYNMTDEQLIAEGYADGLPVLHFKDLDEFETALGIKDAVEVKGELITDEDIREAEQLEKKKAKQLTRSRKNVHV